MTNTADYLHDLFNLAGQKALVTGASAGIGRAIALNLARAGATVAVAARQLTAAQRVVDEICAEGGQAVAVSGSVDQEASVISMVAAASEQLGGIDILVNNAGIFPVTPILETSAALWDEIQQTNVRGTFLCLREVARTMQARGNGGCIINISSIGGVRSSVPARSCYDASKAAVNRFTAEAALELAPLGIRVNAVLPGPIATEKLEAMGEQGQQLRDKINQQIPLGRWGSPDEIASACIFLASKAGAFVTGQLYAVDGGAVLI